MKSITALVSVLATVLLTLALLGWMLARVAEHPGLPRDVGGPPPWFAGEAVSSGTGAKLALPAAPEKAAAPAEEAHAAAGEVTSPSAKERTPSARVAAIPSPPLPAAAGKSTAADDYVDVAGREIKIALKEYRLVPDKIRARPGPLALTFVLRNEGRFAHNFHVEGEGVDVKAAKFGPGNTVRLEVTLKEGEYKISCPLSNHDKRGMHGTLLVTARPGS